MWTSNSPLPDILAHVFARRPDMPVWKWAEENVYLDSKAAAQPGFYDSTKTPWTRRIQELLLDRVTTQITVKKSSVAGYTEACLNAARFKAKYDPCNVIFAIDSQEEAANINEIRLQPTLRALGEDIFTTDDDDVKKYQIALRHMMIWFYGSYSSGKFANKQAPFLIADEVEEHAKTPGDTSTITNLRSRMKSAEGGKLVLLSKPKLETGVICVEFNDGNQEKWFVPCPFCGFHQELLWEGIVYRDCKDLTGDWDKRAVLSQSHYVCTNCKKPIEEKYKRDMNLAGFWKATNEERATPGHVSQHMSDLYSFHPDATWGRLALKCISASVAGRTEQQGFRNHHQGLGWEEQATRTEEQHVYKCRAAYRQNTIPFTPFALLLGSDIGLAYARWAVGAFNSKGGLWIIAKGNELHPDDIRDRVLQTEYYCAEDGKKYPIACGFMDSKYRKEEAYRACLHSQRRLWPMSGLGGQFTRQSLAFGHIPTYPPWFGLISFNDRDFKHELYVDRINLRKPPGFYLPQDIEQDFVIELTHERLEEKRDGHAARQFDWKRTGPNHWGDCVKNMLVGWRYMTRKMAEPEPVQTQALSPQAAALKYIMNAGGRPTVQQFIEDHAPIGAKLLGDLRMDKLVKVDGGRVFIASEAALTAP